MQSEIVYSALDDTVASYPENTHSKNYARYLSLGLVSQTATHLQFERALAEHGTEAISFSHG